MKKIFLTLGTILLAAAVACADNKPISIEKLPQKAQEFLKSYFADQKPTLVTQDRDFGEHDYDVTLTDGTHIDFTASGEWQEVDARGGAVPATLVPEGVKKYVEEHYAAERIVRLERDRRSWEVKLSNGMELTFDKQCHLIDIDD